MGNKSSSEVSVVNQITMDAASDCGTVKSTNINIMNHSVYDPPADCTPEQRQLTVDQSTSVDATCYLSALQSYSAETAVNLTEEQKAALGINADDSEVDIQNQIAINTTQACADVSTSNVNIINDTRINACGYIVTQNATANQNCQINATIDLLNNAEATVTKSQEGWDPIGDFFDLVESIGTGYVISSVASSGLCALVITVIVAAIFLRKGQSTPDLSPISEDIQDDLAAAATEFMTGGKSKTKVILWIIAILGIILMVLLLASKPRIFRSKPKEPIDKPYFAFGVPNVMIA